MPRATDAHRAVMAKWFGSAVDEQGPYAFLRARGWTDVGGLLIPPVPAHNPSLYEYACIEFLCDEWDFAYNGRELLNDEGRPDNAYRS